LRLWRRNFPATAKRNLEGTARNHRQRGSRGFHSAAELVAERARAYGLSGVQAHLAEMDISSIIPDLILISETLNAMLVESLRSFLSGNQIAA
jgi:hypothetical protein